MNNKTSPQHYFMVAALVIFTRDDQTKQRHMNGILELPRKVISTQALNDARRALIQRLNDEVGETFSGVNEIIFLSFNYLGHAKPHDFFDTQAAEQHSSIH